MATLNSSSTYQEVKAAYIDNASYAEDGDLTKAKAFVTACRILMVFMPDKTGKGKQELQLTQNLIESRKEIETATKWIRSYNVSASQVGYSNFSGFRE